MTKTALELSPTEWKNYSLPPRSITPEVQARWDKAWKLIPELARTLREEFGATKIKVFGSAVRVDYFSEDSDIDLAAWDIPIAHYLSAALVMNEFHPDFKIDLLDPTLCRLSLRETIENEGIEV